MMMIRKNEMNTMKMMVMVFAVAMVLTMMPRGARSMDFAMGGHDLPAPDAPVADKPAGLSRSKESRGVPNVVSPEKIIAFQPVKTASKEKAQDDGRRVGSDDEEGRWGWGYEAEMEQLFQSRRRASNLEAHFPAYLNPNVRGGSPPRFEPNKPFLRRSPSSGHQELSKLDRDSPVFSIERFIEPRMSPSLSPEQLRKASIPIVDEAMDSLLEDGKAGEVLQAVNKHAAKHGSSMDALENAIPHLQSSEVKQKLLKALDNAAAAASSQEYANNAHRDNADYEREADNAMKIGARRAAMPVAEEANSGKWWDRYTGAGAH